MADYQSSYKGSVIDQTVSTVLNGQAGIQGVSVNGTELTPDSNNKVSFNVPNVLQTTGSSTTDTMSQDAITTALSGKASVSTYTATLLSSGWTGGSAPYTQTVSVSGILSNDKAFADVVLSDDTSTAQSQLTNWAYVSKMETSNGSVTATCFDSKPNIDLNVSLMAIRG
jgi:hypothetical protein